MSNKTTFKRIALAVVAALGFGVLASGPSNGDVLSSSFSLSTQTSAITAGETATTKVSLSFFASEIGDSVTVNVSGANSTSDALVSPDIKLNVTDSSLATIGGNNSAAAFVMATSASSASATFDLTLKTASTLAAGTYTFNVFPTRRGATGGALSSTAPITWTVTVAAADLKPSASKSKAYLAFGTYYAGIPTTDSTVVVDRALNTAAGWIVFDQRNASDTNTVGGVSIYESVSASVSGPGFISRDGGTTKVRTLTTILASETVSVFADGTAGVGTITFTTSTMKTWTSKSVTFTGPMTTATATLGDTHISLASADSAVVRVSPKDSGSNLVTTAQTVYIYSSDTSVVSDNGRSCSVTASAVDGYGTCFITVAKAGSAVITVRDAATVAASTWSAEAGTVNITGNPHKITMKLDKTSYKPGEAATLLITVTDSNGKGVSDRTIVNMFDAGGIKNTLGLGSASDVITGETVAVTGTDGYGTKKYTIYMPNSSGQQVISAGVGSGILADSALTLAETVTVVDPAETAANSALDAAQDAADAAIEAGDAATLAQEAADEAAQAAQDAQATAQAAVDAVTALSGEVTKLVAQLATLQKIINRIAKKVGVKTK